MLVFGVVRMVIGVQIAQGSIDDADTQSPDLDRDPEHDTDAVRTLDQGPLVVVAVQAQVAATDAKDQYQGPVLVVDVVPILVQHPEEKDHCLLVAHGPQGVLQGVLDPLVVLQGVLDLQDDLGPLDDPLHLRTLDQHLETKISFI